MAAEPAVGSASAQGTGTISIGLIETVRVACQGNVLRCQRRRARVTHLDEQIARFRADRRLIVLALGTELNCGDRADDKRCRGFEQRTPSGRLRYKVVQAPKGYTLWTFI